MAGRGRQSRISKAEVLALLSQGYSVRKIFQDAGYAHTSTYYTWRSSDDVFRRRADAIIEGLTDPGPSLSEPEEEGPVAEPEVEPPAEKPSDWREAFVEAYRQSRSRVQAGREVGKSASEIMSALDKEGDKFDARLAAMMEEVYLEEALAVEDTLKRQALRDNNRHAIDKILPHLPVVGEKYQKKGPVDNENHGLSMTFHIHNQNRAIDALETMLGQVGEREIKEIAPPEVTTAFKH